MADDGTASWIGFLIDAGGYPDNRINRVGLAAWAQSEGIPESCHNPLASSDRLPGDRCCLPGSDSIPCYVSDMDAAQLYFRKFRSGQYGYGQIDIALNLAQTFYDLWHAVNMSAWCCAKYDSSRGCLSPCQSGKYPVALHALIGNEGNAGYGSTKVPSPPPWQAPPERAAPKPLSFLKAWDKLDFRVTHTLPSNLEASRGTRLRLARAARYVAKHKAGSWPGSGG